MHTWQPEGKWVWLWRLRLGAIWLGIGLLLFLAWRLAPGLVRPWLRFALWGWGALLILLLALGLCFFPYWRAATVYELTPAVLCIRRDIWSRKVIALRRQGLWQAVVGAGPLERLLGLCHLRAVNAGRTLLLCGLTFSQARRLQRRLCPPFGGTGEAPPPREAD